MGYSFHHHLTVPVVLLIVSSTFSHVASQSSKQQGSEGYLVHNSTFVLAAERTHRVDPLHGSGTTKRYTGGWNISNEHYWASVAFTAAPLFLISILWFILFGVTLLVIFCCYCCGCRREPYGFSPTAYGLSFIFLILFTIAAIIGCAFLYTGQGKFHTTTTDTLAYVVKQAYTTVDNLHNVSDTLFAAKQVGVDNIFLPSDVQSRIDNIDSKIDASATNLAHRTGNNSDKIQTALDDVRLSLLIVASIMLLLALLGFLVSLLGMQFVVYTLVIIGWVLVAGTFMLCGIFFLLHNVVADTCVALDQWVHNPTADTALDDILPCVDGATANQTLFETREVTYQLVNMVNQVITNVSNINYAPNFATVYYNQSGPLMPLLCNPFHPDMTSRKCNTGEVDLDEATQVWQNYICQVSASGNCTTVGRVTPELYSQMSASANVSNGLYHYGPVLVQLEDCSFLRETFAYIAKVYCPRLEQYSKWTYVGLVMVSTAVMLSLIFWIVYSRERRHRVYTKHKQLTAETSESP